MPTTETNRTVIEYRALPEPTQLQYEQLPLPTQRLVGRIADLAENVAEELYEAGKLPENLILEGKEGEDEPYSGDDAA